MCSIPHGFKQVNLLLAYMFFYNPLRLLRALVAPKNRRGCLADAGAQLLGMAGSLRNVRHRLPWAWHLLVGRRELHDGPLVSKIPMRSVDGGRAAHSLENDAYTKAWAKEPADAIS